MASVSKEVRTEPLSVAGLSLRGAGLNETIIRSAVSPAIIVERGPCTIEDLTIELTGERRECAIRVLVDPKDAEGIIIRNVEIRGVRLEERATLD